MLEEIFYRYNQFESGIAPLPESFKFLDLGAAPGGSGGAEQSMDFHGSVDFRGCTAAWKSELYPEKLCASTAKFSASCAGKNIAGNNVWRVRLATDKPNYRITTHSCSWATATSTGLPTGHFTSVRSAFKAGHRIKSTQ